MKIKNMKQRGIVAASTLLAVSVLSVPATAYAVEGGTGAGTGGGGGTGAGTGGGGTGAVTPAPSAPGGGYEGNGGYSPPPIQNAPVIVAPPADNTQWRPNPWEGGGYNNYQPIYQSNPLPIGPARIQAPPPMIIPEPGMIRVGNIQEEKPEWITVQEMNTINRGSAYIESRIAQAWIAAGLSPKEADRRAATMIAGGVLGGAIGGGAGALAGGLPAAAVGAIIGGLIGVPVGGAIGAAVLCAGICPVLPPLSAPALVGGYIIGGIAGGLIGAAAGAAVGGLIGATLVGVPSAALGVYLGSVFGSGDPNGEAPIWKKKDGSGKIVPLENDMEVYWDGQQSIRDFVKKTYGVTIKDGDIPGDLADFRVDLNIKDEDGENVWVAKFGEERWIGATQKQREAIYASYGPVGKDIGKVIEDKNGPVQTNVREFFERLNKQDSKNTEYNPNGSIQDQNVKPKRAPYGTTPTPDLWDEPNREGAAERNAQNEKPLPLPIPKDETPKESPSVQAPPMKAEAEPKPVERPLVPNTPITAKAVSQAATDLFGAQAGQDAEKVLAGSGAR